MIPINKQTAIIMSNPTKETDLEKVKNKIEKLRERMALFGDGKLSYKDFQRKRSLGKELDKANREWSKLKKEYKSPREFSQIFIDVARELLPKTQFDLLMHETNIRMPI